MHSTHPDNIEAQANGNYVHRNGALECDEEALSWADTMLSAAHQINRISSFLDVGCRTGYVTRHIKKSLPNAHIVGLDLIEEFLHEASARNSPQTVCASASSLPFTNNSFDWVFCAQTLEHIPELPEAISELCRVAKYAQFISVPLETKPDTIFCGHNHFYLNPLDWLSLWSPHPDWYLFWSEVLPLKGILNFILIRSNLFPNLSYTR